MDGGGEPLGRPVQWAAAPKGRPRGAPSQRRSKPLPLPTGRQDPAFRSFDFNDPSLPGRAREPVAPWQLGFMVLVLGIFGGAALIDYRLPIALGLGLLTVTFFFISIVRTMALAELWRSRRRRQPTLTRLTRPDHALPVYSILVAAYREAAVIGDLIAALEALDYPKDRLDIIFVLERDDPETLNVIQRCGTWLPHRILIASPTGPRTKPKALNCALPLINGQYVVIYDAEDRPEPSQLRRAIEVFDAARWAESGLGGALRPRLVCVQAELNIYNPRDSWFTRQFTIEYSALFGAILPSMSRRGWPIPLGGTSNHFEADALIALGGWDPYNVTEDADLGMRIARAGFSTAVVPSVTWEEAPRTFPVWLRQRTRWIKGWIVTLLVHTREPRALLRDLGLAKTLALFISMGGTILSCFASPLAWIGVALWLADWRLFDGDDSGTGLILQHVAMALGTLAVVNLVIGYASAMLMAAIATYRRHGALAWHALALPIFWLLITLAAIRAAYQLWRNPHAWEKTPHGPTRPSSRAQRAAAAKPVLRQG